MSDKIKKTTPIDSNKKIFKGADWDLAIASTNDDIISLLNTGYEPFSVDQGVVWLKKKNK